MAWVRHRDRITGSVGSLAAIRLAYLLGAAASLLWVPVQHGGPGGSLLLRTFDRWDSLWFVRIASHGYSTKQAAAFFPVYPLLVRGVAFVLRNHVAAGMVVSLTAAAGCAWLLERIARRHLSADGARATVLLLALYPFAFVFTAVYSDAVFLFFVLAAVDAAERGAALLAGAAAAVAVDTRLLGLALLPALAVLLRPRVWSLVLAPAALGLWMLYLHVHYGDWLAYSHAEHAGWQRQTPSPHAWWHELRTLESEVSNLLFHLPAPGPHGYPAYVNLAAYGVVDLLCLLLALWLSWVAWKRIGAAYGLYSFATLAIVVAAPAADQPLVSLPRFLLADFPLFLALATYPRARGVLYGLFAALGAAAAVGFAHGVGIT